MIVEVLSSELYVARAAITNMHNWMKSIAEAVDGHADQLEAASADFTAALAQLTPSLSVEELDRYERIRDSYRKKA